MPGKSATDAMFSLRMLMRKHRKGQKDLHCLFMAMEKAYNPAPRDELWYCLRKAKVTKKYVNVIQDMNESSSKRMKCVIESTNWFKVNVGLHQGSALSPFLFAILIGR